MSLISLRTSPPFSRATGGAATRIPLMTAPLDSEADLVRRARRGDVDAFEDLYRDHIGRIYAVSLRMVADPSSEISGCTTNMVSYSRTLPPLGQACWPEPSLECAPRAGTGGELSRAERDLGPRQCASGRCGGGGIARAGGRRKPRQLGQA